MMDEPLRMSCVGELEYVLPPGDHLLCASVVDGFGCEQAETQMAVLGVVPGKEGSAERSRFLDRSEPLLVS